MGSMSVRERSISRLDRAESWTVKSHNITGHSNETTGFVACCNQKIRDFGYLSAVIEIPCVVVIDLVWRLESSPQVTYSIWI